MKFKKPVRRYYFGKQQNGCPYFYPRNFVPSVIKIYKKEPWVKRTWNREILGCHVQIGWPIMWHRVSLGYKWKYGTPRYEWAPQFGLYFFGFEFHWWDNAPLLEGKKYHDNDTYYEMKIWTEQECKGDFELAEKTWRWENMDGKSSWENKYLEI